MLPLLCPARCRAGLHCRVPVEQDMYTFSSRTSTVLPWCKGSKVQHGTSDQASLDCSLLLATLMSAKLTAGGSLDIPFLADAKQVWLNWDSAYVLGMMDSGLPLRLRPSVVLGQGCSLRFLPSQAAEARPACCGVCLCASNHLQSHWRLRVSRAMRMTASDQAK